MRSEQKKEAAREKAAYERALKMVADIFNSVGENAPDDPQVVSSALCQAFRELGKSCKGANWIHDPEYVIASAFAAWLYGEAEHSHPKSIAGSQFMAFAAAYRAWFTVQDAFYTVDGLRDEGWISIEVAQNLITDPDDGEAHT